jgi:hypothetical protein
MMSTIQAIAFRFNKLREMRKSFPEIEITASGDPPAMDDLQRRPVDQPTEASKSGTTPPAAVLWSRA